MAPKSGPKKEVELPPLTFKKVTRGAGGCECLLHGRIDTESVYIRESKNERELQSDDFVSWWQAPHLKKIVERKAAEEGRELTCEDICGMKGLSVQQHCIDSKYILQFFKKRDDRHPYRRPYLHMVKLGDRIGLLKPFENDPYHCNLFVSDEFDPTKPYEKGHIKAIRVSRVDAIDIDTIYNV